MRKNKKLLLASVAAMGALALGVGATSTFAWYTASQAADPAVGTVTNGTITTTDPSVELGGLTFDFTLKVNGTTTASVYIGTYDADTVTKAIYKVWNPAKTELLPYDIGNSGTGAAIYSSYFQEVSIEVDAIKVSGSDIKGTAASLNPYAGTYTFNLTASNEGVLIATAPTNSLTLGQAYKANLKTLSFTVIIPSSGTTLTGTFDDDDSYYIAIRGDDSSSKVDGSGNALETTTLGVSWDSVSYA